MEALGVATDLVHVTPGLPTGHVTIRLTGGQPDYTIHRPAAYDLLLAPERTLHADWICFGTLLSMNGQARDTLRQVIHDNPHARRFYDVNLRRDAWTPELVADLAVSADIVKLNEEEARILGFEHRDNLCITRAERGCTLRIAGQTVEVPGVPVQVADAVGAGDAWAAAFLHGFSAGWPLERTGAFANGVGALVASRQGAIPDWTPDELI
jgi:fructokinase